MIRLFSVIQSTECVQKSFRNIEILMVTLEQTNHSALRQVKNLCLALISFPATIYMINICHLKSLRGRKTKYLDAEQSLRRCQITISKTWKEQSRNLTKVKRPEKAGRGFGESCYVLLFRIETKIY